MKKIYTLIFAIIALFAFVPATNAQEKPYEDDGSGICYSKKVGKPNSQGVYTITLESFVTGSVTMKNESAPADIVLVLDLSQSMTQKYPQTNSPNSRLYALQRAVEDFLEVIYHNDNFKDETDDNPRTKPLGNRISVITFGGSRNTTTTTQTRTHLTFVTNSDGTKNTSIISYISGLRDSNLNSNYGTFADEGMNLANTELTVGTGANNYITPERKDTSSRTVVLFTDGAPGDYSSWRGPDNNNDRSYRTAERCITAAYQIKNSREATVFTVLLGNIENTDMGNYLQYTSSNYPSATSLTNSGAINPKVDPDDPETSYAKQAGDDLGAVFTTIAKASGGSDKDLSEATVSNVDVVSASFTLPVDLGDLDEDEIQAWADENIKLYTAAYLGTKDSQGYLQFGDKKLKGTSTDTYYVREKDDAGVVHLVEPPILVDEGLSVSLTSSVEGGKIDKIVVTGFDYANNFCGEDDLLDAGFNGHKVIIEIPIKMAEDALGGPDVDTNGPESGIYINGEPVIKFVSPEVSLPVNIHIRKEGLKVGESAKFTIERKLRTEPESAYEAVTSIFVTRHEGDAQEGDNAPMTKVVGMPSTDSSDRPYVYRVVENDWSWSYTSEALTGTNTDDQTENPFIFKNTEKSNIDVKVRHAESKATNTFHPDKTKVQYDDSKPRKTESK